MVARMEEMDRLDAAEACLGYRFEDRSLLACALRHPSAGHERVGNDGDNQRLEFLGDAVLGLLAADELFARYPELPEGRLTVMRSQLSSGKALARMARELDLGALLEMGRGEEATGGRSRRGNLADALEALLGAVWLDGGVAAARAVFRIVAARELSDDMADQLWIHKSKGELQELCQRRWSCEPSYEVVERTGADHAPHFKVRVSIPVEEAPDAEGEGGGRRAAETAAAAALLKQLR
jgi:ribonuclease-3